MTMTRTLRNEPYHVLTLSDSQSGVQWNGHYWPRDYTCEVVSESSDGRLTKRQSLLSCGHWTRITDRFCPHCGRAIVVRI